MRSPRVKQPTRTCEALKPPRQFLSLPATQSAGVLSREPVRNADAQAHPRPAASESARQLDPQGLPGPPGTPVASARDLTNRGLSEDAATAAPGKDLVEGPPPLKPGAAPTPGTAVHPGIVMRRQDPPGGAGSRLNAPYLGTSS